MTSNITIPEATLQTEIDKDNTPVVTVKIDDEFVTLKSDRELIVLYHAEWFHLVKHVSSQIGDGNDQ